MGGNKELEYHKELIAQRQNFGFGQILSICSRQFSCHSDNDFCLWWGRRHCGKRRKFNLYLKAMQQHDGTHMDVLD